MTLTRVVTHFVSINFAQEVSRIRSHLRLAEIYYFAGSTNVQTELNFYTLG